MASNKPSSFNFSATRYTDLEREGKRLREIPVYNNGWVVTLLLQWKPQNFMFHIVDAYYINFGFNIIVDYWIAPNF